MKYDSKMLNININHFITLKVSQTESRYQPPKRAGVTQPSFVSKGFQPTL